MLDEDFSVYFDEDDFADSVSIDGTVISGIVSRNYVESNFVQTNSPVLIYRADDMPDVAIDSTVIYGSSTYKVKGIQPDETQRVNMLILERQ